MVLLSGLGRVAAPSQYRGVLQNVGRVPNTLQRRKRGDRLSVGA